ncbi:MAG: methylmalonyl-CoA mutase [Chloroflexi bacterium]|nr:methylmalonyl-CoA mutase [Chloroflexota bacterium]
MLSNKEIADMERTFAAWQKKNEEALKHERKPQFLCPSGIPIKTVYTPLDLVEKGFDYNRDLGMPGEYPYTRGITPTGYRGHLWHISQYAGHPLPEESNKLWRAALEAGMTDINIAYDLPTQMGYDPDHPNAEGEVARIGVSMSSQRDWEVAFDGIDIDKVYVTQVANAVSAIGIANYFVLAQKRGLDFKTLKGICQNDILKEYIIRGAYIFPPGPSLRLATDILIYCSDHAPTYQALQVCGNHYSEAQGTPVHDAAFMLADAFCYYQTLKDRGVEADRVAPNIQLLSQHEHYGFFQEIAKIRAVRKIYATVLSERFGARKPESLTARIYSGHGGNSLQRRQYLNNIARGAIACLQAAISGVQHLDIRGYDEQFGIPTKEALISSIRVQHVVSQETGVTDTVDPLAGSYYVEWLTKEFEERILKEIETIEKMGGVLRCIENGYLKRVLAQDAYEFQKDLEAGRVIRVGANFFTSKEEDRPLTVHRTNPQSEAIRVAAVKEVRAKRDNRKVRQALDEVKAMALAPATIENNLMPPIIEAVRAYATVGEISDVLREAWGEYKDSITVW